VSVNGKQNRRRCNGLGPKLSGGKRPSGKAYFPMAIFILAQHNTTRNNRLFSPIFLAPKSLVIGNLILQLIPTYFYKSIH